MDASEPQSCVTPLTWSPSSAPEDGGRSSNGQTPSYTIYDQSKPFFPSYPFREDLGQEQKSNDTLNVRLGTVSPVQMLEPASANVQLYPTTSNCNNEVQAASFIQADSQETERARQTQLQVMPDPSISSSYCQDISTMPSLSAVQPLGGRLLPERPQMIKTPSCPADYAKPRVTLSPAQAPVIRTPSVPPVRSISPLADIPVNQADSQTNMSMLAPLPLTIKTALSSQQQENALLFYRQRELSACSAGSGSASVLRQQFADQYRESFSSYSPASSSISSHYGDSAFSADDERGFHSASPAHSIHSASPAQYTTAGFQTYEQQNVHDYLDYGQLSLSASHPNTHYFESMQAANAPTYQRTLSSPRHSSHPYYSVYGQLSRSNSQNDYSTNGTVHYTNEGYQSSPEVLIGPQYEHTSFDESTLRAKPEATQSDNLREMWTIPSAEDVLSAALQLSRENAGTQRAEEMDHKPLIGLGIEGVLNHAHQAQPMWDQGRVSMYPRRMTRSASKSMGSVDLFQLDKAGVMTVAEEEEAMNSDRKEGSTSLHSTYTSTKPHRCAHAGKLPASGKAVSAKSSMNNINLGLHTPLHLLPTKRSRGRRPVVSPELNLDPNIESTTAATNAQISFSGLTKTGKAKKIFVCRVPGCDKCFRRTEHLKRHIRSIHSTETREWLMAIAFSASKLTEFSC